MKEKNGEQTFEIKKKLKYVYFYLFGPKWKISNRIYVAKREVIALTMTPHDDNSNSDLLCSKK